MLEAEWTCSQSAEKIACDILNGALQHRTRKKNMRTTLDMFRGVFFESCKRQVQSARSCRCAAPDFFVARGFGNSGFSDDVHKTYDYLGG